MRWFELPVLPANPEPWQSPPSLVEDLRKHIDSEPTRSNEMRYEALRLAANDRPHATPEEVVAHAKAYFNFLKGE